MEKDVICFYHGNCTDGAAAAAVIRYKYPNAWCIAMQHGDPIEVDVSKKIVFIVDFSFSEEVLKDIKAKAESVYWYDHHKTVIPTYQSLGWGVIDLAESGATLTWKEEFPNKPVPKILQYVKDKDIWAWKLPHSREVNMALREMDDILDPTGKSWKKFLDGINDSDFERIIDLGAAALNGLKLRILNGAQFAFEVDFQGYRTLAVNWSLESSEMGEHIYQDLGYDIALIFHYTGEHWRFSMRSKQVDVSQIASQYGGGGHPGAAGFRSDSIEWLMKLRKN
ncbi:MAG: hypothetical protein JNK65_02735 [Deltaproteobacteria bacterium]|nr:hypothetical protein [Deltaproteobacteria bacterium]